MDGSRTFYILVPLDSLDRWYVKTLLFHDMDSIFLFSALLGGPHDAATPRPTQEEKVNMTEQSSTEAHPAAEALLSLVQHRQGGLAAALPELTAIAANLPAPTRRLIRDHLLRTLRTTLYRTFPAKRAAQLIEEALAETDATQQPTGDYERMIAAVLALTNMKGLTWRHMMTVF
jgi:hypothetical protein